MAEDPWCTFRHNLTLGMTGHARSLGALRQAVVYGRAKQAIILATCRSEERTRVEAQFGWLFEELAIVEVPDLLTFPSELQAEIVERFKRLGARHTDEWDGKLGSLVLGLSRKHFQYEDLVQQGGLSVGILHAMKLLQKAGTSK